MLLNPYPYPNSARAMPFGELDEHRDDAQQLGASIFDHVFVGDPDLHRGVQDGGTFCRRATCDPIEAGFGIAAELSCPFCDIGADG